MANHEESHEGTPLTYVGILVALLILTGVTTGAAFVNLGRGNAPIALLIACTKATLVILFFMHVRHSTKLTKVTIAGALFWLVLLIAGTMNDVVTRGWLPYPGK